MFSSFIDKSPAGQDSSFRRCYGIVAILLRPAVYMAYADRIESMPGLCAAVSTTGLEGQFRPDGRNRDYHELPGRDAHVLPSRRRKAVSTVTIEEAQAKLPELIELLSPGQEVIITRDAQPVAKLVSQAGSEPQPVFGRGRGKVSIVAEDEQHLEDFKDYMP
jgi:antitoxin (DNA-binding transcriptional repressor) of toxin-antitoxin stability system